MQGIKSYFSQPFQLQFYICHYHNNLYQTDWERGCLTFWALTFGAEVWKFILVTGTGAEDSMEMMTTSTSGRDGGESRAKWNRTRKLCPSNTVTGNRLPEGREDRRKQGEMKTETTAAITKQGFGQIVGRKPSGCPSWLTGLNGF